MEGCWRALFFDSQRRDARLFTCVRAWRCAVLRRKHRFHVATAREWRQVHFFEQELPLHAVVTSLNHQGQELSDPPFELVTFASALFPGCAVLLDECRRTPLFYALEQQWRLEKLSWLVDKTLAAILEKDTEGLSLVVSAVANNCPDEMVIWMAVAVAQSCLESSQQLLNGRQYESARRYCQRMLQDYFSGVPEFPLAQCRHILISQQHEDVLVAVTRIRAIWQAFVDKWGYYGPPIIQRDLPSVLHATIDSFVKVSVVAKGEPLAYQWFNDDVPIENATQSFLYISQSIQPHNAGRYYCEVSNWKGQAASVSMKVQVVDDQFESDPTLKFQIPRELLHTDDVIHRVRTSAGALLYHKETGARLLLPPHAFKCLDAHDADVSDSLGLEVLMRTLSPQSNVKLRRGETLVSCVIELLPHTVPVFLRPLTLSIPHSMDPNDRHNELVVVRVDSATGSYQDLQSFGSHLSQQKQPQSRESSKCQASAEISAFGAFAVVSRGRSSNLDVDEKPLELAKVFFVRPKRISTAAYHKGIATSLWIARDRPDPIQSATLEIQEHLKDAEDSNRRLWAIDMFTVAMRRGHLLCLQVGTSERIVYQWEAITDKGDRHAALEAHHHCIAPHMQLQPSELMETTATPEEPLPPLCVIKIDIAVRKPSAYATSTSSSSKSEADASTFSVLLSQTQWKVLIPVANDTPRVPPMPQLMQRTPTHVVLSYELSEAPPVKSNSSSSSGGRRKSTFNAGVSSRLSLLEAGRTTMAADTEDSEDKAKSENRFEELHEGEREFSPYFYVVELAKFSETFWQRYDRTWWFDKTKTSVIDGMYKVVHCGFEPFAKVSTDAFAGCFRVAQCSLDGFGAYSEPLLLEPLVTDEVSSQPSRPESSGNGVLVNKLRSLQRSSSPPAAHYQDCSATLVESKAKLQQLLTTSYAASTTRSPHFEALFGFPTDGDIESVMRSLETMKRDLGASNRELALLLLALRRLKTRGRKVRVRKLWIAKWIEKLQLLERLVPELDCYPVEFFAKVTMKLHEIIQDTFSIVVALSSNGWLQQ
ncbi:hypothetical protein Gpo141_00003232 [Globisporangium polare]